LVTSKIETLISTNPAPPGVSHISENGINIFLRVLVEEAMDISTPG
jgi:hypothetical protein